MTPKTRLAGLLWPLLDHHGDRDAEDLPPEYHGHMRAMYAACETFMAAEVAAVEARPGRRWRVALALLRLGWLAGQIAGVARVKSSRPAKGPPTV